MNKFNIKKYGLEIFLTIVLIIISIIVFIFSQTTDSFKNINIHKFIEILFGNSIGLITIWISSHFILIQLYKNTYPMEIIESRFMKKVKIILIFSSIVMIIGALVINIFNTFIAEIYYTILFSINTYLIFYYTYKINREFKLNTYIDEYLQDLSKSLNEKSITKKEIDKNFKKLYNLFNECIVKDEYYICNNISKKIGKLFTELIMNYGKLVVDDNKEIAEYMLNEIINFGRYQVDAAKNSKSEDLIDSLFYQQGKNIILCAKIGNIEWFKSYSFEINLLLKDFQNTEKYAIIDELYNMNMKIGEYLLKEKDDIWLKWFLEKLYALNISFKYAFKNININYFCKLLTFLLNEDITNNSSKKYEILKNILSDFTRDLTRINDNVQDVVIYYSLYGNQIYENDDIEKVKDYIKILTSEENRVIVSEKWNEFIFYYLNRTLEKWEEELGENNRNLIIDLILELSLKDPETNYYSVLPQYDDIIFKNRYAYEKITKIIEELEELTVRLIMNSNINMFFLVLRLIKKSLLNLEKKDRDVQEKLFNIYLECLKRAINIENKKYFERTIAVIMDTLGELDKKECISNNFGKFIIYEIAKITDYNAIKESERIALIMLLGHFREENKTFDFLDNDMKKVLYQKLYNIGVECIENNCEESLRVVSNILGWYIIWSIDRDAAYLTTYLIERTIDLFRIGKHMMLTRKTQVYMMTLFTTVGTYCCKEARYNAFLKKIIEFLKEEKTSRINTAIELRTKENNMWDKLLKGKTQELTKKFLKELYNN